MPFVAWIQIFLGLLVAFVVGALGLSVWAARRVLTARQPRALDTAAAAPRRASGGAPARRVRGAAWREGHDLLRYPERLGLLEGRLQTSHAEALDQAAHLRGRGDRVAQKDPSSELVQRYGADAGMLEQRAESMRRVMGLVWRTRAVLGLRAHVAITARGRPDLDQLPDGEVPASQLQGAARTYEAAAEAVRAYVIDVEARLADLAVAVPAPPRQADVAPGDLQAVEAEQARARETYVDLQNRMDQLADTLSYLADRCLTRQVVHHTSQGVEALTGSEGLVDEVSDALRALGELAEIGDRQLADTAMDNLAEDITQLEQAGLDAQAEADATLEIERLLQQFPSRG